MRFLTLGEVLALQRRILAETGGAAGMRDLGAISSSVAQPRVSVGGVDAYSTLIEKAAALGYALARNHGFIEITNQLYKIMETSVMLAPRQPARLDRSVLRELSAVCYGHDQTARLC